MVKRSVSFVITFIDINTLRCQQKLHTLDIACACRFGKNGSAILIHGIYICSGLN